jgi:hypothetical protein
MIKYNELTKAEKAIVDGWRQACQECNTLTQEFIDMPWFTVFRRFKMKKMNQDFHEANMKWHLYFDLMKKSKIV